MAQKAKATTTTKGSMNVVGQSLQATTPGRGGEETEACGASGDSGGGAGGVPVAWSSQPSSPKDFSMVDQVMVVNRSLVQQIDALRLRLQVDSRHHESTRSQLQQDADHKLQTRDQQIAGLKEELRHKEVAVKSLTEENHMKRSEIHSLQHTINALQKDVEDSKVYVDDIQKNLSILQEEKEKLESGVAYREKEELIHRLNNEVQELRGNLSQLERELYKAKEVIATQGSKLRHLEHEKHNIHIKFKEELARANQTMRHEVEKMRDVMKSQWEEMRVLRQQNEGMRTDIKEIKDMLLGGGDMTAEHQGPTYNMGALKPSLPALTKNSRRIVPGKKKPLG
ncbi:uncharacterized protein LOC143280047 [Babylonia areolata]|uniref:uncharacterized protein LOC143280047 n=1 Tax=Babylonia areolata TaxID=304850 RepID=UPI003FD57CCE